MYISLNWIKDYVDLDGVDVESLINQFTLSTAEVEGFERKGENVDKVIVGEIVSIENHPKSQKLHLLKVNNGTNLVDVVCGAPNVRVGLKVPFAVEGATVGDLKIVPAVVGGYTSYGMCCSAKELGISDDNSGLMELPNDWIVGKNIKEYLDIDDVVFEVDNKSLTNRPDLWGHYGIAREIAALTGRTLNPLKLYNGEFGKTPVDVKVNSANCYRYTSTTVENITTKVSPLNMQIRLFYAGMRAINLLTDLTNYIMLECGQPMHAFDNDIVKDIQVNDLVEDTKFTTLDSQERVLPKGTMAICSAGNPVAVAGVMGGLNSEITDNTNKVLIESANFNGAPVRKTALALGMRTESSARYEKMLDPELTKTALLRYLQLLTESDNGVKVTSALTDVYNYHYPKLNIDITKNFIDRFVGVDIPENQIFEILKSLEFDVTKDGDVYHVEVPTFRATKDINGKQDIVEEITRIYGYDNLPALSCNQNVEPVTLDKGVALEYDAKYTLASKFGLNEVHSYIWYDSETNKQLNLKPTSVVRIVNAINKENDEIRSTMVPSMLKVVVDNKNTFSEFGVFEIGRVATELGNENLAVERKSLCVTLYSRNKSQTEQLLTLKEILEYLVTVELKYNLALVPSTPNVDYISPANYYDVVVNNQKVGFIGALHPRNANLIGKNTTVVVTELDFSALIELEQNEVRFAKVSKYPVTGLDFNFLVDGNTNYADIYKIATSLQTELNYNVGLVDIYDDGSGYKSYTLHYDVCSLERTLSSADIETFHKLVINTFENNNIKLKN